MKEFLVDLNATIPIFKNQVRHTGTIPELKARYREHLRPTATPPAKRPAEAVQPTVVKRTKRTNKSEATDDKAKERIPSMLSRLFVTEPVGLSRTTLACLYALGSPLSAQTAVQKGEDRDLSSKLWPLNESISITISARDAITVTCSHTDNCSRLAAEIQKRPIPAPANLKPFLKSMRFTLNEYSEEKDDTVNIEDEAALMSEVDVLCNEVHRALGKWSLTFPSPLSDSMIYPVDFSKDERSALRAFSKHFVSQNSHLTHPGVKKEALLATSKQILATWPIGRGGTS